MPHKLIIGVDYGTTYTGISYVVSTKTEIDDINVIRNWPGPVKEADEVCKTPSRIAYSTENKDCQGTPWGFLVTPKMKSYTWTKLLLDAKTNLTQHDDTSLSKYDQAGYLRLPYHRTATQLVSDYLREIYQFMLSELERRLSPEIIRITPFEFWFTVPAIWSDEAKASTRQAAQNAGFGSRPGDKINMIPEPEAAAIATLSSLTKDGEENQVKPGDGILICDCGGGTVDITTYHVTQTKPALEFEELVVGGGGKCGSTAIDREFLNWMSRKFGKAFDNLKYEKIGPGSRFMKEFESLKRDFGPSSTSNDTYEVPLVIPGAQDSYYYDEDESTVKFYRSDMESFFRPVVDRLTGLLKEQMNLANKESGKRNGTINTVVLVGGFGDSRHLNHQLRAWCKANGNVRLICPVNPQAAIVKGAALRGLGGIAPVRTRCRRHYGFTCSFEFREGVDPESRAWSDPWDNKKFCAGRIDWLISKGQYVDKDTFVSTDLVMNWGVSEKSIIDTVRLFSCSADSQPEFDTDKDATLVGEMKCDFTNVDMSLFNTKKVKGTQMLSIEYSAQVQLGAEVGILCFKAISKGKEIGVAHINYET